MSHLHKQTLNSQTIQRVCRKLKHFFAFFSSFPSYYLTILNDKGIPINMSGDTVFFPTTQIQIPAGENNGFLAAGCQFNIIFLLSFLLYGFSNFLTFHSQMIHNSCWPFFKISISLQFLTTSTMLLYLKHHHSSPKIMIRSPNWLPYFFIWSHSLFPPHDLVQWFSTRCGGRGREAGDICPCLETSFGSYIGNRECRRLL